MTTSVASAKPIATPLPAAAAKPSAAEARAAAKQEAKFEEFVVVLDDQATRSVEKAFAMPMGLERRQYVAKTLIDNMVKTQAPLWKALDGLQAAGHVSQARGYKPLWIQNAIVVYGDESAKTILGNMAGVAQAIKSATHVLDTPGAHVDQLAPLEGAINGAEALADLPVDVAHAAGARAGSGIARDAAPSDMTVSTPQQREKTAADYAKDPQWNLSRVHVEKARADGLTGKGVTVGVIDTGLDYTHPFLLSRYRGYDPTTGQVSHVGNWFDSVDDPSAVPVDEGRHGTHVAGTIGGYYDGVQTGAAPDVDIVAARGLGPKGGSDGMLLSSFQNMVAPRVPVPNSNAGSKRVVALGPDLINNSWGSDNGTSVSYMHALRNMDAMGIINFFAAGNDGAAGASTIGSPASSPHIITVGATDQDDKPAGFTARGPNPLPVENGEPVPFVSAPGVTIRSTVPGGGLQFDWQGTSMATPLVTAIGALAQQAAVEETGRMFDTKAMKEVLKRAAVDVGEPGVDDSTGHGIPVVDDLRNIVRQVAIDLSLMDAKSAKQ